METNKNYVWITVKIQFENEKNDKFKILGIISVDKSPKRAIQWAIHRGGQRIYTEMGCDLKLSAILYKQQNTKYGYKITRHKLYD